LMVHRRPSKTRPAVAGPVRILSTGPPLRLARVYSAPNAGREPAGLMRSSQLATPGVSAPGFAPRVLRLPPFPGRRSEAAAREASSLQGGRRPSWADRPPLLVVEPQRPRLFRQQARILGMCGLGSASAPNLVSLSVAPPRKTARTGSSRPVTPAAGIRHRLVAMSESEGERLATGNVRHHAPGGRTGDPGRPDVRRPIRQDFPQAIAFLGS
jgi:hypothetical protein